MRVLMTVDAVGGVWQYAVQLVSMLAAHNARVTLATMGPDPSPAQRAEALSIPGVTLRTGGFSLEWMPNAWDEVDRAGEWLLDLETECAPDIVHLNGYVHGSLPWRAPVLIVGHSCVSSWWVAVHGCAPPAEWDEYRNRVARGLAAAAAVVTPSGAMADALKNHYGVTRPIEVIANCCDATMRSVEHKEAFVFSAGRVWDPAKNIAMLDDVAAALPWPVYVAGDEASPSGGGATRLRHAHALGRLGRDEMQDWMSRASIYVLPARYEPFGLSILEAAFAGCALVLGDVASLREHWSGVAHFVHPDRAAELRSVVHALIEAPELRKSMGCRARSHAQRFVPQAHATAYERLYRDMVATHGRTADTSRTL
jgi:glycogen synthase